MSPAALVLALALHGIAAAALWWASTLQPAAPPEYAIMVTVDTGAPPAGAGSPTAAATLAPRPPAGAPDPAPSESPREEPQRQALAEPSPAPPKQPPTQSPPLPRLEDALTPPEGPPPPSARDFPILKPLPPWPSPSPRQAAPSQPPPRPRQPAPAPPTQSGPAGVPAPPSNSADWLIGKGSARNAYLDQVARLTARYRRYPRGVVDVSQRGRVVTRVTIGRDGRLIDVSIDTSSGWPAIDAAELETIRRSAPFPPVPADMPGDPLILILPISFLALR
jgi:periplasmic protein TonB